MSRYIQDPDNSSKQVPGTLPENAYDRVYTPATCSLVKTPHSVFIAAGAGTVGFYFGSSASFSDLGAAGKLATANYQTFGTTDDQWLNIHPTAWSGSAADNDADPPVVKFVYNSGLSTGAR